MGYNYSTLKKYNARNIVLFLNEFFDKFLTLNIVIMKKMIILNLLLLLNLELFAQNIERVVSKFVKCRCISDENEELLLKHSEEVLQAATKFLKDSNIEIRENALDIINMAVNENTDSKVIKKVVEVFSSALFDPSENVRATACGNLASYNYADFSDKAKSHFAYIYNNNLAKNYNCGFIELTGFLNIKEAIPYFKEKVRNPKVRYYLNYQIALSRMGDADATSYLVKTMNEHLRISTVYDYEYIPYAFQMRNQAGLEVLIKLLDSDLQPNYKSEDHGADTQKQIAYRYLTKMLSNLPEQFEEQSGAKEQKISDLREYLHSLSRSKIEINTNKI